jgi:hypothetical protein
MPVLALREACTTLDSVESHSYADILRLHIPFRSKMSSSGATCWTLEEICIMLGPHREYSVVVNVPECAAVAHR